MARRRTNAPLELDPETYRRLRDAPMFSGELKTGADNLIADNAHYQRVVDDALAKDSDLEKVAASVRVATKRSHIEALALAYAFWIKASVNTGYENFLIAAAKRRKRIRSDTTGLHLIVDRFIVYGDDDISSTGKKRGLYNRDVRIILWMQKQGISPDEIVKLSERPGEGLVAWDRRQRKSKSADKLSKNNKLPLAEAHQSALDRRATMFRNDDMIELLMSFRHGDSESQHFSFEVPNTEQANGIIQEFRRQLKAEIARVRVGQTRTYNAVMRE